VEVAKIIGSAAGGRSDAPLLRIQAGVACSIACGCEPPGAPQMRKISGRDEIHGRRNSLYNVRYLKSNELEQGKWPRI